MKKTITLLLILILLPSTFLGCSAKKESTTQDKPPVETTPPPTEITNDKKPDPNLPTKSCKEIDTEMDAILLSLLKYLEVNSDNTALIPNKSPNGTGAMYQDLLFSSFSNVKGNNNGSFHVYPGRDKRDYIRIILGYAYDENLNSLPSQFEELFKIAFPKVATEKTITQYISEMDKSPKIYNYGNDEFRIGKSKKDDGRTMITAAYEFKINITD